MPHLATPRRPVAPAVPAVGGVDAGDAVLSRHRTASVRQAGKPSTA